jgi:hypothetical protein
MVRHEAAEALGAIAAPECLELLRQVGGHGLLLLSLMHAPLHMPAPPPALSKPMLRQRLRPGAQRWCAPPTVGVLCPVPHPSPAAYCCSMLLTLSQS